MSVPFCSACGIEVPDLSIDHHVCVSDGDKGFIVTTRDKASKALDLALKDGISVHKALEKV